MNRLLTCLLLLLLPGPLARADLVRDQITAQGVISFTNAYREWNGTNFEAALKLFQQACADPAATATNYYWLGVGAFHCALYRLGEGADGPHRAAAREYLDAAAAALQKAVVLEPTQAESHALLGTIYGMEIGENWLRAVWLGPKLEKEMQLATTYGTNDARVSYLLGTSQYYCAHSTRARREALKTLLTAEALFAIEAGEPVGPLTPVWGRDSCHTFVGACYENLGQAGEAGVYYRKALALHPEDGLARAGLARVTKHIP